MPDFTRDPIKFNPQGAGNSTTDPNEPTSDWTGYIPAAGPLGVWSYKTIAELLALDPDSPLAAALAPSPITQIDAQARFTDGDAAGLYILGNGVKAASGANASEPMKVFPASATYLAAYPIQKWVLGAIFAVNGTAIPDTVDIDVGAYRVTAGGGADALAYTLSGTGKIVEAYGDGISTGIFGDPNPDRRADFAAAGDQNYALGVELHSALPADCVLDLYASLQISPY